MLRTASSRALMRAERVAQFRSQYPGLARVLGMTEAEAQDVLAFLADQELRESAAFAKGRQDGSFRARLSENDALTDAQAESLAAALQEDREQYAKELADQIGTNGIAVVQGLYGRALMTSSPASDEDAQERQLIEQAETYNRRAHDRAAAILNSRQLQVFEEFQAAQLASDRVRVRAMRETDPPK